MLCVTILISAVFVWSCDLRVGDLANLPKKELAYEICRQGGMEEHLIDYSWNTLVSFRDQGALPEEVFHGFFTLCGPTCGGDPDCGTFCRACFLALSEAVFYSDGGSLPQVPSGTDLKLPLPGGRYWLLTTEAGGRDCASSYYLDSHQGLNYYSLDFDDLSLTGAGAQPVQETNVPVLAAGDGRVAIVGRDPSHPNGYYVVIKHGSDTNVTAGYSTRYLHLRDNPLVSQGQEVRTGQRLGILGNTGQSTGSHLHFGVRFNDSGRENVSELTLVSVEGIPLKEFKTVCVNGVRDNYYPSTNTER